MRSGVADCICLAAGGRLPKPRARQITQLCISHAEKAVVVERLLLQQQVP